MPSVFNWKMLKYISKSNILRCEMKKEINSTPFRISRLFVFFALLFSTSHVQPACTHTFNPHLYIQGHKTESVFRGTDHTLKDSLFSVTKECTTTPERSSSTRTCCSNGFFPAAWSSANNFCCSSHLLSNSNNTVCTQMFNHIRFIKHQSFSDAPQNSVLI
jgi:hypothetical protein